MAPNRHKNETFESEEGGKRARENSLMSIRFVFALHSSPYSSLYNAHSSFEFVDGFSLEARLPDIVGRARFNQM